MARGGHAILHLRADVDADRFGEVTVDLGPSMLPLSALPEVLRTQVPPELIVLELHGSGGQIPPVGQELMHLGVTAIVEITEPISEQQRAAFIDRFYRDVLVGEAIDVAVQHGRFTLMLSDASHVSFGGIRVYSAVREPRLSGLRSGAAQAGPSAPYTAALRQQTGAGPSSSV